MFPARLRLPLALFFALATFAPSAEATRLFQSNFLTQPMNTTFAFFPDFALVGDINGDGIRDLYFVPNQGGPGRVAYGLGDGTFAPDFASNASTDEYWVLLLDLNRDGKADLVQQSTLPGVALKVQLGLGDGNFAPATSYGVPSQGTFSRFFGGDLDGDGWTDIVFATDSSYVVWRNHEDGTLEAPVVHAAHFAAKGLADVDGDGKLDLWGVELETDQVAVALGHGDGTFGPAIVSAPGTPTAIGDLDGDGKADALGISGGAGAIFFGDGTGVFTLGPSATPYLGWDGIADLDGDGRNEGIAVDQVSSRSVVQSVNADRTLPSPTTYPAPALYAPLEYTWTGFQDLNGDGHPDLVGTANSSAEYSVALGGGSSPLPNVPEFATGSHPMELAVGDFNRDGKLDVVTANAASGTVSVLLWNGAGYLAPHVDYPAGSRPVALASADLDGDGDLDLAVADSTGNDVQVLLGNGDGTFAPATPFATGNGPNGIAIGDLNHDGILDIVTADRGFTVTVIRGLGGGAFGAPVSVACGGAPLKVALGDFDGDTFLDAAVVGGSTLFIFHNDKAGGLVLSQTSPLPSATARGVAVADVNVDGVPDVMVASRGGIATFRGNGTGTFNAPVNRGARGAFGIAVGDLDGDGWPDVVAATDLFGQPVQPYSGGASFFHGRYGDFFGTLDPWVGYGTHGTPCDVAIGDFNKDGFPDLVVANTSVSTVSILLQGANGPVPALASIVSAEGSTDRVRLVWQGAPYLAATLYRRMASGEWAIVAPVVADASGRILYEDGDVVAGQSYSYRLGAGQGASEIFFGDVTVRTPLGASFALGGVSPNPASGPWSVSFSLPGSGPARLEVIDLAGRIVASREVGRFGEGAHVLALPETGSLLTGVYFLRLTRAGTTKLAKVVAIR